MVTLLRSKGGYVFIQEVKEFLLPQLLDDRGGESEDIKIGKGLPIEQEWALTVVCQDIYDS